MTDRRLSTATSPLRGASLPGAMRRFANNAFLIRGRAGRGEYWWWMLVNVVVLSAFQLGIPIAITGETPQSNLVVGPLGPGLFANLTLVELTEGNAPQGGVASFSLIVALVWTLLTIVPGFTIAIRRLHDSDLSGWWVLLALLPFGTLVLLLLCLRAPRPTGTRFDAPS